MARLSKANKALMGEFQERARAEHTPGPWRVSTDHYHIESGAQSVAAVFGVNGHGQIPAETEANARLIAAAPELLEACKALAIWAGCAINDAEASERYKQAIAAIAKAEVK